jgi:transcriptional regulator with XRE-family HTH domain
MSRAQPRLIGAALRRARAAKGLTQADLGEMADVAPETLSRIERNKLSASLDLTRRLAQALGVTVDHLVNEQGPAPGTKIRPAEARLLALVRHLDDPQVVELTKAVKTLLALGRAKR